jgi:WD40 repeat protein
MRLMIHRAALAVTDPSKEEVVPTSGRGFMPRISAAVLALSGLLAACVGVGTPLPHSVYYLDGPAEEAQVWRLEADGLSRVQVTNEEAGVDQFAVSSADGTIAFVSNNHLFLMGGDGENRRIVADDREVDREAEDYIFRGFIEAPVFSPDGRTLAYAFNGLHLYNLASGEDKHVLTNLGNLLGEPFVFARENYFPGPWSPDGSMLLILMGYFEGSTLAVMELEAEQFTRLWSSGAVCCQYSWAPDGHSVLVANPSYSVVWPGLWRYDAETGEETVVVPGIAQDGSVNFVGWPHQLPSGDLLYFHVNLERFSPDVGIPLVMVRSAPDGSNRSPLRPEEFRINSALWAPDGSLALILNLSNGDSVRVTSDDIMQVVLARTDGSPLQVLIEGECIRGLEWGP